MRWRGTGCKPVFGDGPKPRLVHLAEVSAELAARKAEEFGFEKSTGDWRALIADPEVEVVVGDDAQRRSTPRWRSRRSKPASTSGAKKPMAVALADAERMEAAATARSRQGRGAGLQLHPEPG